jgi:hypoxanthine-DNA glycosylase
MSLARHEYYGNPQNHFWPIVEALFGIDRSAPYTERTARLLDWGVAVWDVIARCMRVGSGDDRIEEAAPNPLLDLWAEYPRIRRIAFNGGTAHRTARRFAPDMLQLAGVGCEQLPSTSPRNARISLPTKVEAWRRITAWLGEPS